MNIPTIAFISCFSFLAPITAGAMKIMRLPKAMMIFLFYCAAVFIQMIVEIAFALSGMNNLEIENYGMMFETLFIGIVYVTALKEDKFRSVIYSLLGLYTVMLIVSRLLLHVPGRIDPVENTLGKSIIICYGIVYLYHELRRRNVPIASKPVFWVAFGSMIYAVGTIILFGLGDALSAMGYAVFLKAWYINFVLIIVANIIYMRAFLCKST